MADKPRNLHPLAEKVLGELAGRPESGEIVLGGYFALQHYVDYRVTHDIDAWWRTKASPATVEALRSAVENVAAREGGEVEERQFGDTLSFELRRGGRKFFSFQIAVRSVELEPPVVSAWPPILIETLQDNIGAKMNALVERGAPRDFLDIRRVVESGHVTVDQCWRLWERKNPGATAETGKRKVLLHLSALEQRRPLEAIADAAERSRAEDTRKWFRGAFLEAGA